MLKSGIRFAWIAMATLVDAGTGRDRVRAEPAPALDPGSTALAAALSEPPLGRRFEGLPLLPPSSHEVVATTARWLLATARVEVVADKVAEVVVGLQKQARMWRRRCPVRRGAY